MNAKSPKTQEYQNTIPLKWPEPQVDNESLWSDDALNRYSFGTSLTNLVRLQPEPLVVSIHGDWGTGKTFFLKRWQQQLHLDNFSSIYFNAWEDDHFSDPLLAIVGQLAHAFEDSPYQKYLPKLQEAAEALLVQNLATVLTTLTGIKVPDKVGAVFRNISLEEYQHQRQQKQELRSLLQELSSNVRERQGQPLIFIIDELDRCRPTFSINLLERLKHIFDIPNIIFVLGINRDQLCSSIQSIYGQIDANAYLHRFFDIELLLPQFSVVSFTRHLYQRFNVQQYFKELGPLLGNREIIGDANDYLHYFPSLYSQMNLSLRDIEHCVRSFVLAGKSISDGCNIYPTLIGTLTALRLKERYAV